MTRVITVGAAQLGPIQRSDARPQVIKRLLDLLHQAKAHGCDLVVFPELALTTFFPRWWMEDQAEIDGLKRQIDDLQKRLGQSAALPRLRAARHGRVLHRGPGRRSYSLGRAGGL